MTKKGHECSFKTKKKLPLKEDKGIHYEFDLFKKFIAESSDHGSIKREL